jgi:hypothetical protein
MSGPEEWVAELLDELRSEEAEAALEALDAKPAGLDHYPVAVEVGAVRSAAIATPRVRT